MASMYDILVTANGVERYRLNKCFISKDKIPEQVLSVLSVDNIVDENGMIIVDQKNEAAKAPTEDNEIEMTGKLQRVDEPEEVEAVPEPSAQDAPAVDDSANEEALIEDNEAIDLSDNEDEQTTASEDEAPVAKPAPRVVRVEDKVEEPQIEKTAAVYDTPKAPVETFKSKVPQSTPGMGFPRVNGKTVDIFDGKTPHTHCKNVGGFAVPLSLNSFKTKTEGQILAKLRELGMEPIDFSAIDNPESNAGNALISEDTEIDEDIRLG